MDRELFEDAVACGETAFDNENYDVALEWFEKAYEQDSKDVYVLSRAGALCVQLERYDKAFDYFNKAIDIDPNNGDNIYNLANAYFFKGNINKAMELYTEAETKQCSDDVKTQIYYQLAMLCIAKGDVKAALVNLQKFEDSDTTGAATEPDVITQKIGIYMQLEDYDNAAKYAIELINTAPHELRSYMVYMNILLAFGNYDEAERIINDAYKYAELDEESKLTLDFNKASLYTTKAEVDPDNAVEYYQMAYDIFEELYKSSKNTVQYKETAVSFAELCVKLQQYDEALNILNEVENAEPVKTAKTEQPADNTDELAEQLTIKMLEQDMLAIDERIANGEISDELGNYAEEYIDENGNKIREFPGDHFRENNKAEIPSLPTDTEASESSEAEDNYNDRINFIRLSCYTSLDDYDKSLKYSRLIKNSSNLYFRYFGVYAEAYSIRMLSTNEDSDFTTEQAEDTYTKAIAYFRSQMLNNDAGGFAATFRARLYAETAKFAKAVEMANVLSQSDRAELLEYIDKCKKEFDATK